MTRTSTRGDGADAEDEEDEDDARAVLNPGRRQLGHQVMQMCTMAKASITSTWSSLVTTQSIIDALCRRCPSAPLSSLLPHP